MTATMENKQNKKFNLNFAKKYKVLLDYRAQKKPLVLCVDILSVDRLSEIRRFVGLAFELKKNFSR